jgi:hypothetical protein
MLRAVAFPRPLLLPAIGAGLVGVVSVFVAWRGATLTALPLHDFVEYWAAGRLLLAGENPYDPARMHELEREAGRTDAGILMWNPPWVLPLVAPLGLLEVRSAHLLWLLFHSSVVVFSAGALWHLYAVRSRRMVAVLLAFSFLPVWFALIAGQISPLLLLGAVGFLLLLGQGRDFLAGSATVLLAIKPHLVYLFWLALLLWAVRERRWRVLLGGALTGLMLTGLVLALDASVVGQYHHTFTSSPPAQYRSPTLGTLLRLALGEGSFRWQFLAMLPGLLWFALHWRRCRQNWEWTEQMPLLLLVGVLTTAYGGWPFDLVVLLVPVIALAAELARTGSPTRCGVAIAVYVAINWLGLVLLSRGVEYLGFIWMTPALLLAYVGLRQPLAGFQQGWRPVGGGG